MKKEQEQRAGLLFCNFEVKRWNTVNSLSNMQT